MVRADGEPFATPLSARARIGRRALPGLAVLLGVAAHTLPSETMDRDALRVPPKQPLKDRYRETPAEALVTLTATGTLDDEIACNVQTGRALATAGLHPATGGDGALLCSGDMLLEALVACAGVTLRAVATALEIEVRSGTITASGELDFRGTLGVDKDRACRLREHRPEVRPRRARRHRGAARDAAQAHRALLRGAPDVRSSPPVAASL